MYPNSLIRSRNSSARGGMSVAQVAHMEPEPQRGGMSVARNVYLEPYPNPKYLFALP